MASVQAAVFADKVTVTCDGGIGHITSDTYPDHEMRTGIVGTNEQIPVPAKDYAAPIPLSPVLGATPQTRDTALGVAVNGVLIYSDYTAGGEMTVADLVAVALMGRALAAPCHAPGAFTLSSPAMTDGAALPNDLKCLRDHGDGVSPPLDWSGVPDGPKASR